MNHERIPDEVIDAVLKHNDIVDVVGKYVHLTKSGKNFKGLCPFHSEKSPSFIVNVEKQIYKCFGCGAGGNAITFIRDIESFSFAEAVKELAVEANMDITWEPSSQEQTVEQQETAAMVDGHEFAAKLYHYLLLNTEEGKVGLSYLRSRGFTDALIETFQLGYASGRRDVLVQYFQKRQYNLSLMEKAGLVKRTDSGEWTDMFRERVMFPIHDAKGRKIAFAGRTPGNMQPKYLNSPETKLFHKATLLYNFHQAKSAIRKSGQIVLLEGYADVIKAWDAGVENSVATMGTSLTADHSGFIKRFVEDVIICYDADSAGQAAAYKSLPILEQIGLRVKVAMIPDQMDPDEFITSRGADAFNRDVLQQAVTAVKYRLIFLKKQYNLQTQDGKLKYLRNALQIIARISSPTEREFYVKELSSEFDISMETLKQDMNMIRQEIQKITDNGDNIDNQWNNVRNGRRINPPGHLLPAYQRAEQNLLAVMMHDSQVAQYVQRELDDHFNVEDHAALAAYLYSYYARGFEADPSKFIATLQDEKLEKVSSSILMAGSSDGINEQVINDFIREIKKFPLQKEINEKKERLIAAERSGNIQLAANIASEINTLVRHLKST